MVPPIYGGISRQNALFAPKCGKITAIPREPIFSYYPTNNGFASSPTSTTLQPGQIITRYGSNTGQYASPIGTSLPSRALPLGTDVSTISGFEVIKSIPSVFAGPARAWFGQPGGGTQFFFGVGRTIQSLIEGGYLQQLP